MAASKPVVVRQDGEAAPVRWVPYVRLPVQVSHHLELHPPIPPPSDPDHEAYKAIAKTVGRMKLLPEPEALPEAHSVMQS